MGTRHGPGQEAGLALVLGWICIALSSFGLLCGGLGMLMLPFSAKMMEGMFEGAPPPPSISPSVATIALGLVGLVITVVLLIASIMLVTRKPASRVLFLVYAGLGLPLNFASFMNQLSIQAAMKQWAADYPNNPMAQGQDQPGAQIGQMIGAGAVLAHRARMAAVLAAVVRADQNQGAPDHGGNRRRVPRRLILTGNRR